MTAGTDAATSPSTATRPPGVVPGRDVTLDYVVFDLGGVIFTWTEALPQLAERIGAPSGTSVEAFRAAYGAHRNEYDRDSDAVAYWTSVARLCGAPEPSFADVEALSVLDTDGWSHPDPAVVGVIEDLHRAGLQLAVLSNAPARMAANVRSQPWGGLFDHVVMSGALGLLKPEPAIYEHLLGELAAPADRVAFTDDLVTNVAGASAVGIHGIHFTGAAALRGALADFRIPLGAPLSPAPEIHV